MPTLSEDQHDKTNWLSATEVINRSHFSRSGLYRFINSHSKTIEVRGAEVTRCPPLGGMRCSSEWKFREDQVEDFIDPT